MGVAHAARAVINSAGKGGREKRRGGGAGAGAAPQLAVGQQGHVGVGVASWSDAFTWLGGLPPSAALLCLSVLCTERAALWGRESRWGSVYACAQNGPESGERSGEYGLLCLDVAPRVR